ncbi:hypothetical protein F5B20DRAFT_562212 [Whalleya microplaca]|nr:hypothetical protein F5B20DRAFT_562212 [Whalleya microplaca]
MEHTHSSPFDPLHVHVPVGCESFDPQLLSLGCHQQDDGDDLPQSSLVNREADQVTRKLEDEISHGISTAVPTKRTKLKADNDHSVGRKFACPFFQRDRHRKQLSRSCTGPGWENIARVKEHIYRCHMKSNQCNRCQESFENPGELATHQRAEVPCERREVRSAGIISEDQSTQLKHRKKSSQASTLEDKWVSMYRIIFPDDSLVPSPYYDGPCGQCISNNELQLLDEFRQYQLRGFPPLIRRELAGIPGIGMNENLLTRVTDVVQQSYTRLYSDFLVFRGLNMPKGDTTLASHLSKSSNSEVGDKTMPDNVEYSFSSNPSPPAEDLIDVLLWNNTD